MEDSIEKYRKRVELKQTESAGDQSLAVATDREV